MHYCSAPTSIIEAKRVTALLATVVIGGEKPAKIKKVSDSIRISFFL